MSTQQSRVRARAARRRHLQQRQTVIFGTLIAVMLVGGLAAGAIWTGILPSPFTVAINSPEPTDAGASMPCPPENATFVPLSEISANVLNGTDRQGLAATAATALTEQGIAVGNQANAESRFAGEARIIAGPQGLPAAFTAAQLFADATIEVDSRSGETIDVVIGAEFEDLRADDEIAIDPEAPIPAAAECTPLATATPTDSGEQAEG
ncbi:LytR C-terminal domain-containing protein [Ruania zhangjianzhongii]|uniref:LytR C-terminal domain-containing protein n=1 Tax=Ruania zhangjianzhongii TaxID=2603206 RepID=UPI0011CCC6A0|nr:LytR C-terminal domain-containing protein [Ruania zhangjianzhongii]